MDSSNYNVGDYVKMHTAMVMAIATPNGIYHVSKDIGMIVAVYSDKISVMIDFGIGIDNLGYHVSHSMHSLLDKESCIPLNSKMAKVLFCEKDFRKIEGRITRIS